MQTALPKLAIKQTQAISPKGNCSKCYCTSSFYGGTLVREFVSSISSLYCGKAEISLRLSHKQDSYGTDQPMILSPVTANSRCLGKEDYQPHVTRQGGPSRVHSPQHAVAQGYPTGGVVLVSSSVFFSPIMCPVVFWPHINFWYTVGCLIRS